MLRTTATSAMLLLCLLHRIEGSAEGLLGVDLVAALGVEEPVPYERLRLASVLGVVDAHADMRRARVDTGVRHELFAAVGADFTLTPRRDFGEVLVGDLHRIDIQRLPHVLARVDRHR